MRKLPVLTALAISALSLSTHSLGAQGYAPWPPPPGMTAGEYAARYGHRITPDDYRSGSVTAHSHGLPARCSSWRTRPMVRPSTMATPSVPGAESGKVRRHVTALGFMAQGFPVGPAGAFEPLESV